ncbi:hypothetical protein BGX34_010120 [Mortierella sp. NVP85]|nr:hypothetical protein BGX34_010120 [Mortierella sp. NVP85]
MADNESPATPLQVVLPSDPTPLPLPSPTLSPSNSTASSLTTTSSSATDLSDTATADNNSTAPTSNNHSNDNIELRKTEAPPKQRSKNGYIARVGFDTLDCEDTGEYAFTLRARTDQWRRTKHTRTFLVCTDLNDYSSHALQWVMENMVEDGDEVIALRVVPMELRDSFAKSGIPSFQGQEFAARSEATKIMDMIRQKNKSKEINIIVECLVGNVKDTISYMIRMYEPSMLVVGTRGRNSVKGLLLGSLSRYFLNHSPIPVTVVRPASKLIKSKAKSKGIFRRRSSVIPSDLEDEDVPPPQLFYSSPLSRQTSRTSQDPEPAEAAAMAELERGESRSPEPITYVPTTAAAKASAAKRASLFPSISPPSSFIPPSPQQSISSSLSYASAMLSNSSSPPTSRPAPEGIIKLTKSLTTDGTPGPGAFSVSKKMSHRMSLARLSGSIFSGPLSLGNNKKRSRA